MSAWAITTALALAPAGASAQVLSRFAVHLEGGAGTMLSPYQRDQLGYGLMAQGAVRVGFTLAGPLALQLSGESWFAPGSQQSGQQLSALGGLRVEPRVGRVTRLFVDANAGLGQSIDLSRVALSAGLGAEFSLGAGFAVGPVARFGALFATSQDYPSDALYWSAGVSASWRYEPRERPAPPPDRDADGGLPLMLIAAA